MRNQDSIKVGLPHQEVFKHCQRLLEENDFNIQNVDEASGKIAAATGISWESFGEKINVEVEDLGGGQTLVRLLSKSRFPFQFIDWGKNNQNVKNLVEGLQKL